MTLHESAPKIPKGYRRVKRHELVKAGDFRMGPITGEWVPCQASVGYRPGIKIIIREVESK